MLRNYYRFRVGTHWYLLALLGAPILLLAVAIAIRRASALSTFAGHVSELPTTYLLNIIVIATLVSLCEERAGWHS